MKPVPGKNAAAAALAAEKAAATAGIRAAAAVVDGPGNRHGRFRVNLALY